MHDLFPSFLTDFNYRQVIIYVFIFLALYLVSLIIPGVGVIIKHVSHTITKYLIHPIFKYVFEALTLLLLKLFWWYLKYMLFALRVYLFHIITPHDKIYPELKGKELGVIDE